MRDCWWPFLTCPRTQLTCDMIRRKTSGIIGASNGPQRFGFVKMNAFHVVVAHGVVEVIQKAGAGIWWCKISNHAKLVSNTLGNIVFVITKPRTLSSISEQIPKGQGGRVKK